MTMSARISQSAFDGSRLRVILLLDLHEGAQEQFLEAYEHMRNKVASVPGHISDQLCQSIENPSQWLITSEWESALPFLAWVNSEEHIQIVRPMHSCVRDTRSMRYSVLHETHPERPLTPEAAEAGLQKVARVGASVTRHALTFTVKPGSESKVVDILANYDAPETRINDITRLHRTSLFMHGNRVVRAVEVEGDLLATLCHVAGQPEVQAVEEAINPHLEQDRDLSDYDSARVFFTRAALPAMQHVMAGRPEPAGLRRHMLYYPALAGRGLELARFLARQDEAAANDPDSPVYASTVFQRDDVVTRMIDVTGELDRDPAAALGIKGPGKAAELERLLDGAAIGVEGSLDSERTLHRLLAHADMMPVTDRISADS
ncbi:SchA/CurD-like domain-containing protein [Streptomyces sp. Tu 3180]|uniref:SchA/CurD-like domain-containing protein n=1 Tax=Streptomyces sp. Tu 3180 TaxID=2682611 RepID=UPI0013568957|nr:SchA/CurD-like domain-containing protein [Streptomyces sp. Tu 3180]KAF3463890.1 TcmI family type II polyketide cyclase [Streptomyces sp. Tu 3180]